MPTSAKKTVEAAEPRGPRGKKPAPLTNEQVAILRELWSLPKGARAVLELSPKQVAALTGRAPKTLDKDRREQRAALEKNQKIDPQHPMSLPYVPPAGTEREVRYIAQDLLDYLARRAKVVDRSFLKRGAENPRMRGFQSWLAFGSPAETWPFCMQPDGRPLDMAEAIATKRLTEDAERLNIREFCEKLANAASRSGVDAEREELENSTPRASNRGAKKPATRWDRPGGPV